MRGVRSNLTGKKYGHLYVIGLASKQGRPGTWWTCVCDCGMFCEKAGKDLTKLTAAGWIHSCGCRPALAKSIQKRLHVQQRLDLLKRG